MPTTPPFKTPGIDASLEATRAFYEIRNVFHTYTGLGCNFISAENGQWMPLQFGWRFMRPHHFEQYYGTVRLRDEYNRRQIARTTKRSKTFLASHNGFTDAFAPVRVAGVFRGTLMSGPFRTAPFTSAELRANWRKMTGSDASALDPNFLRYVRMSLETPVLVPEVLKYLVELLDLSARLIGGGDPTPIWKRVDTLRPLFSRHLWHVYWVDWTIGQDQFYFAPEHGELLHDWEREELGITRFPTTVFAAMPVDRESKPDPLDALVTAAALQREAFRAAHSYPETVGHPLEDYGALFVTSADPRKNATQARLEIRDRARDIAETLSRRLKVRIAVGVGNPSPRGGPLALSYQQAVSALHLCVQMGRSMMFFDEAPVPAAGGMIALKQQAVKLVEAYLRGSKSTFRIARERYLEQALLSSFDSLDVFRAHLLSTLSDLLEAFRRRHAPDEDAYASLASTMEARLKVPSGVQALSGTFRDTLESFLAYGDRPRGARAHVRMEHAQRFVDEHYAEPLVLADIARRFDQSVSTFHRGFRKLTGRTFGSYLTAKRLEEAKRLLKTTTLPLEQVAQACGFNSASYFIQSFRKAFRVTPGQYRDGKH